MPAISALPIAIISVILLGAAVLTYKFYLSYVKENYDDYPHIEHTDLLETAILMFFFVGITVPISYFIPIDSYPVYIVVPVVVVLFVIIVVPLHSVLIRQKERVVTENVSQEEPEDVEVDGNLKDARDDILDDE
jgi:nucleoside recognition membrane protein YjiH